METILKVGNQVSDFIPFVSTATNLFDLFMKYAILPKCDRETILGNEYYSLVYYKEDIRMIALLFPLINTIAAIVAAILDFVEQDYYNRSFVVQMVNRDGAFLQYAKPRWQDDYEIVLMALRRDEESVNYTCSLKYASERLRDNTDLVLESVSNITCGFKYASERIKNDPEIVLEAVEKNCDKAVQYASRRLREDDQLALRLIAIKFNSIYYFEPEVKRKVLLQTIDQHGWEFHYGELGFSDDKEVVLAAISKLGRSLAWASDRLKDDKEVVLKAIENQKSAFEHVSERLKNDPDVILAASR